MEKKRKEITREGDLGREQGENYLHYMRYPQAHEALDISLFFHPTDIHTLLARSRLYEKYFQYQNAITDVNTALEAEPDHFDVLQRQAQVQFLQSDFEFGLISNYRGIPKRKQPPEFQLGVLQCKEAIESCIDKKAGHVLRNYYETIKKLEVKKHKAAQIAFENRWKRLVNPKELRKRKVTNLIEIVTSQKKVKSLGPNPSSNDKFVISENEGRKLVQPSHLQTDMSLSQDSSKHDSVKIDRPVQRRTTNIVNFVSEKYLEGMRFDKKLLLICTKNGIDIPQKKGNDKIKASAARGYNECFTCQESLRSRNPFYAIRYREMEVLKALYRKKLREILRVQSITKAEADNIIAVLRAARENYNIYVCQVISNRALDFFESKSKLQLPKKDEYMEITSNIIGLAYLDTLRINPNAAPQLSYRRVKFMLGLPLNEMPSKDSLIDSMKPPIIDTKKQIEKTENRIRVGRSSLELAWLYYDLAKYFISVKKYEIGNHYARLCVMHAENIGNEIWAINGCFLMIKSFVNLRNRNDAKEECLRAIDRVKILYYPNKDTLMEFMSICSQLIDELDYEELETTDAIKDRESAILGVLDAQRRQRLSQLFGKMSSVPAFRRLSIMPGIRLRDNDVPKGKTSHRGSIVNPNILKTKQPLPPLSRSKRASGDAFLEMI